LSQPPEQPNLQPGSAVTPKFNIRRGIPHRRDLDGLEEDHLTAISALRQFLVRWFTVLA
jgi:hypothetical protein